jgi:RND family efflux transporter MFP subunit
MPDAIEPATFSGRQIKRGAIVLVSVFAAILVVGIVVRLSDRSALAKRTTSQALPTVSVFHPAADKGGHDLTLPGSIEAWSLAPVYARTSGYLKSWNVDIGSKVKEGQVLAEIDAPELDQQLAAAQANLATAEANRQLAATTADRWKKLVEKDAVSRQEADEKIAELAARAAMANAARAEVDRLKALEGFKRIVAPFDGVVTSRSTDVGALISPAGGSQPLFTVADMRKMRVYVRVPQNYSTSIGPGVAATLAVPEYPGRTFKAELTRSAGAVNNQTGTVLTQLTADNSDGLLKSGAYADVTFKVAAQSNVVRVPASALIFRKEGTLVATLDAQGTVELKPVVIAQDLGAQVDIGAGLSAADTVVDNPSEALSSGDKVRPIDPTAKASNE